MKEKLLKVLIFVLLPVGLGLLALYVLSAIFRARSPDLELVRGLQDAFREALAAERSARRAQTLTSVVRLSVLAAGVGGPLVLTYLLYRLRSGQEIGPGELLDVLESERLTELGQKQGEPHELPEHPDHLLPEAKQDDDEQHTA
ncbi:MAG: hypothetical protein ACOC7S_01680 [Planctomycetota bacterium]